MGIRISEESGSLWRLGVALRSEWGRQSPARRRVPASFGHINITEKKRRESPWLETEEVTLETYASAVRGHESKTQKTNILGILVWHPGTQEGSIRT